MRWSRKWRRAAGFLNSPVRMPDVKFSDSQFPVVWPALQCRVVTILGKDIKLYIPDCYLFELLTVLEKTLLMSFPRRRKSRKAQGMVHSRHTPNAGSPRRRGWLLSVAIRLNLLQVCADDYQTFTISIRFDCIELQVQRIFIFLCNILKCTHVHVSVDHSRML